MELKILMDGEILIIIYDFENEIINIIEWLKNDSEAEITEKTNKETLKQYMIYTIINLIRYTINKLLKIINKKNIEHFNKIKSNYDNDKYKTIIYYLFDSINNYYDNKEDIKYFLNDESIIYISKKTEIKYKDHKKNNDFLNNLIIIINKYFN